MHLSRISGLASRFHRRPLLVTLRLLLQRIPFRPVDINCFYLFEYAGIPPHNPQFCRGRAEVRRATRQDLEGMANCQNTPDAFLDRFNSNDDCVVAVADDHIVGYEWFSDKPFYVEERYSYKILIPPDAIYAYDAFVLPEHRLGGIWLKFMSVYLRELMYAQRRKRIITMVDYGNRISMSTHLRFGFKVFLRVFVIRVFGKSIFLTRTIRGDKRALPHWVSIADKPEVGSLSNELCCDRTDPGGKSGAWENAVRYATRRII
jgi:hypothetical protein